MFGFEKNNVVFDSDSSDDETQADNPGSPQSEKMTMKDLENQWKLDLNSILEELSKDDYEKLFLYLVKIPERMKDKKYRLKMPQIIIQRYGLHESVKVISKAMDGIPRKDRKIQDLIQPMLEKLEALNQQHTKNKQRSAGGEDVQSPGRPSKRKRQLNPQPEMDSGASMKAKRKKTKEKDSSIVGSSAALQKTLTPCLKITISDLKASGDLGQKVLIVKVVQKSDPCQSKNKSTFYFYLGVADETDVIKVVVFGRERFPDIETGHFYTIRDATMNRQKNVLIVTDKTTMSETGPFKVPRNVELEAEKLIFSPVYSIREIQHFGDKKEVSVEGTVKEIGPIKSIQMKPKRMKKDKQDFELDDGTGSITVDLWGEDTKHLRGISCGDVVLVNNLMTNRFKDTVSLNSTNSIRITKVQSAQVQDVNITIIGIRKIDRINAELEVQINNQVKTLKVSCLLLAKAVGLRLKDDFRAKLLKKLKLKAKAQIQGNKIKELKAVA